MKFLDVPRSGSYQGLTSSRNRNGQYLRTRATPVQPGTSFQSAVRSRLQTRAAEWRLLTSDQRDGWAALGLQMIRTDALGQSYDLTGFQAYQSLNNNLVAAGAAAVAAAPTIETPDAILTMTVTLTSASFSIAWTPTPLGTGEYLLAFISPQRSAGRTYEGDYRLIAVSAAAAASPLNVLSAYTGRFGAPVTGNRVFLSLLRMKAGFVSVPLRGTQVVS